MSIEGRLTSLQTKLDQLLDIVKLDPNNPLLDKSSGPYATAASRAAAGGVGSNGSHYSHNRVAPEYPQRVRSAQAEIRSLELWRCVVAECLGTLCYVFFVCGVSIPWTGHFPPFLSVAFASALAYAALTYQVFPGAHLNPAFTIALTSIKYISPLRCVLFLTAQAGGAIAGAAVLFSLTVPGYQGSLGATTIASHINPAQAFGMELILCFVMTLTFITDPCNSLPTTAVLLAANLVAIVQHKKKI
ncbi:Neurogenic protein big brain, partial [Orchesella cincta]